MSVEENKAVHRRVYEEVWNRGDLAVIDELIADDYIYHPLPEGRGPAWYKQMYRDFSGTFSDFHYRVEDMVAEKDMVVARTTIFGIHDREFLGVPPTGKKLSFSEIAIVRIRDGKIVEEWGTPDLFSALQQLGAVP